MSAAVSLYRAFEDAEREGKTVPSGTREFTVDARLCALLAKKTLIEADDIYRAFYLTPVRFCFHILRWAQDGAPGDLTEQTKMIICTGEKKHGTAEHRIEQKTMRCSARPPRGVA